MQHKSKLMKIFGIYTIVIVLITSVLAFGMIYDSKIEKNNSSILINKFSQLNPQNNNDCEIELSKELLEDGSILIGDKNANLTIIQYTDYESPFCKKFDKKIFDDIKKDFIDTKQINVIIKPYPVYNKNHKNSILSANSVKCAQEQNKGFEMHEFLFKEKGMNKEKIKKASKILQLNESQFEICINNNRYYDEIINNLNETKEEKINVLPTLIIGEEKIEGVKPYFIIKKVIEKELEKKTNNNN